ncbi:MAG TPA: ATP-binding protein [Polyangiaceae bacterium]|nr:ATP-binding protein [Polyangiaceae bacterium]
MDEFERQAVPQVSPATFARLVEEAPDGVVISRDGIILYVNRAALALLRYDRAEELVGQSMALFLDAQSIGTMVSRIRHMQATGERIAPHEYRATRRDGSTVVAEISSIPIELDGQPAVLAFARDVTERVRLRAQLEQADRLTALGMMAAGVAHEINNPLTFISLATDLLRQRLGPDDGVSRGLLDDIGEGVGRVTAIVRDLRVYSRYEDEPLGAVDLEAVLHGAARIVAHELRSRIRLVHVADSLPPVHGVARRLEQVFVNVYLNAAQAFPDDQTDAIISVQAHVAESTVEIEVSDNGPGMAPDVLARIFEPFFTMRPTGTGTGLGLFICKDILLRVGGSIRAESEVGRGTTVTIALTRAEPTALLEVPPVSTTPLCGRRILVVDDEPLIVSIIVRALGQNNVVVGETSPERALELAFSDPPFDAIVCDMMMEGLTGVDVYERIARERPGMEMRIVFMSGGAHTARTRAFLASVPNRCLAKPFAPEGLSSALAQVAAG